MALSHGAWRSPESRARLGRWLLAANIVMSALALGALHTTTLAISAFLAAASTLLLWYAAKPLHARPAATLLVTTSLVLIGWTVLQCIPFPKGAVAAIAHENADVWSRALSPLRLDGPDWIPLSLDPTATRIQVLRGIVYLLVFIGALRVAQRPEGVAFLERAIVVSGLAFAVAALLHPAFGAHKLFGIYEPGEKAYFPHHYAPLLNTNHQAAYANIGMLVAFASVVRKRDGVPRPIAFASVILLLALTLWALSRGGAGTAVLGIVLVLVMTVASRRAERTKTIAAATFGVVLVVAVVLAAISTSEEAQHKLTHTNTSKVGTVMNAFDLLRSFAIFGVGRGAFESTFPAVRKGTDYWVFTHPENVIAQWTTEWGVPIALLGLVAIMFALRPQTVLARSRPPLGAWAALVAVGLHNLVDFNGEVPGVVIALATCAAIVTGGMGTATAKAARIERWSNRPTTLAIAGAVGAAIGVIATLPFASGELYTEQRELKELGIDRSLSKEAFHARLKEAMLRHPAEPYFPFVGVVRATVVGDESVLPWAGRALERSPVYGRVHLLLARSLFRQNPSQARLEYRLASEQDYQMTGWATMEGARLVGSYEEAFELVPAVNKPNAIIVLENLAGLLAARLPSTVVRLDRDLVARDPMAIAPTRRAAQAALADVKERPSWCEDGRTPCLAEGLEASRRLKATAPSKCEGYALAGELRLEAGEVDAGLDEIDGAIEHIEDPGTCARRLIELAMHAQRSARVDAAINRLVNGACGSQGECVENLLFAAQTEVGRSNTRRALALYKRAAERAPEREDILVTVAELAASEGLHGEALDAYTTLARRQPADPRWPAAVTRERELATRSVFEHR